MRNSTSFLVLLAVTYGTLLFAGCRVIEPRTLPQSHSNASDSAWQTTEQGLGGVAHGPSPDRVEQNTPLVRLGAPIPVVELESEPIDHPVETDRKQPAVLGDCDFSWAYDRSTFVSEFRGDLRSLFTRDNALLLLAAGGASYAVHQSLDDDVAAYTARHPNRWGGVQDIIGGVGNPPHQLAAISGLYAYSLLDENVEAHELSKSLFSAVAITQIGTTALKFAANTTRPNGDPHGWPSGHTSSSFAFASVLDEYYGPCVGLPAYAVAGLVAWERIDDREHDLSDVIFGAVLGYVIGRSVACEHQARFCGMLIDPFCDPATGASGIALERKF